MPSGADGSIIIKTLIDNKGAEAGLRELQAKAKSTSQRLAEIDKQVNATATRRSKLAEDLAAAKTEAEATRRELEMVQARLDAVRFGGNGTINAQDAALADKLNAALTAQETKISSITARYQTQDSLLSRLQSQHTALAGQLEQENAEAARQEHALRGVESVLNRAKRAVAAIGTLGKTAFGLVQKQVRALGTRISQAGQGLEQFKRRLTGIVAGALVFNLLSRGLLQVTNWMGNMAKSTDAVREALANLKGAAYTAAAPILQMLAPAIAAIANAAATAFVYLARLISLLTGKSISSMKTAAKGMAAIGDAAGSASKEMDKAANSMLAIDELNVLQQPAAESGSSGGTSAEEIIPNFDFTAQNPFLDLLLNAIQSGDWAGAGRLLADKLNSVVDGVDATAWGQKLGGWIQNGISFAFAFVTGTNWNEIGAQLARIFNGVLDRVDGGQLGALFAAKLSIAIRAAGSFLSTLDWKQAGTQISNFAKGFVDTLSDAIQSVDWGSIGAGILTMLSSIDWGGILTSLGTLIQPYIPQLLTGLAVYAALKLAPSIMEFILPALLKAAGDALSTFFTSFLPQVLSGLGGILSSIVAAIGLWPVVLAGLIVLFIAVLAAWGDQIQAKLQELDDWLQGIFTQDWSETFGILGNLLNGFFSNVKNIWDSIKQVFDGVIDFIRGVFTGDWKRAWQGVKEIFSGIFGAFKAIALSPINAVIGILNGLIDSINWVINKVNSISFTNPFTGNTVGFNFPTIGKIPYLAQGAVIPPNREFLAVLGDQSNGTNVEAPLATIKQALAEVLAEVSNGGEQDIVVNLTAQLDGDVIYRNQQRIGAKKGFPVGLNPAFD